MKNKKDIAHDWLKRYTGTDPKKYGDWILLTNFQNYVEKFAERFDVNINGMITILRSLIKITPQDTDSSYKLNRISDERM